MARFRFRRGFNINRVVKRLVRSILALYVGGTIVSTFGTVMVNQSSPFFTGLTLIGWTVGSRMFNSTDYCEACSTCTSGVGQSLPTTGANINCITSTTGSGVLAVVGIIAIAQIVTEFISW